MSASFDAHALAHGAQPLHLRFALPSFSLVEHLDGLGIEQVSCERYSVAAWFYPLGRATLLDRIRGIGARVAPFLFRGPIGRTVNIDHGYTIPFVVPLDPARMEIHPNQAITAGGVTLILDRVIATRGEIRVYLRRAQPGHILEDADLALSASAYSCLNGAPLFGDYWTRVAPASRRYDFVFNCGVYHVHTPYTLVVRRNPYEQPGAAWRVLQGGPWTFHFTLP